MSFLTLRQRLDRLDVRAAELDGWRERDSRPIEVWRLDGEPISLRGFWPSVEGLHRFEAEVTVPDGWPIEETELHLDLGGESLLALEPDGGGETLRFGLDPFHQRFPVPAGRFRIRSESVARLPFGEPVREPRLEAASIAWIDRPVHELALLLRQVTETARMLDAHEAAEPLVRAAERCFAALDWPSATADYVARTAAQPMQRRIWRLPKLKAAPDALRQDQRASVRQAHEALVADLKALKARFPQTGALAITGHAHIDLAWLWPYEETRRKARRTFHTALRLMERFPGFVFNQSTAAYYDQIEQDDPALFEAIRARVAEGRWETVGGMWVEPDTNMPTGESFVRQVLYGQRYFEAKFGVRHRVCWLPDCFGFSPALPQILRQGGIDSFFTIKVNWSETNRFPYDLFWWEGLDGSRVLAHTFDNPVRGYNGSTEPEAVIATWRNFRGKTHHDESLLAIGYGDGGGGVTPEMLERQAQLEHFPAVPALRPARIDDFFARVHESAAAPDLPVWLGEMYLELHRATLTTQSHTKKRHREAERALITAETASALAMMLGAEKPASLEPAWRLALKNEFHDILPGSGVREIYEDAERELEEARDAGLARQREAMAAIKGALPAGDDGRTLVVNPSLAERPVRFRGGDGRLVASAAMVAPLGLAVLSARDLEPEPGLETDPRRLENRYLRVAINDDGTLGSVLDKTTGREALADRGNQLWAYPMDKPRNWDAWDMEDDYTARGFELTELEGIDLVETGPHEGAIRVRRRFRDSSIQQTYRLAGNGRRLDIETELDWHDRRVLLRTLFPLAVRSDYATFECAFGAVRRSTHSNTSWDGARFEVPAHRFADLSEPGFGVALLNDAKYGHSARGSTLGLSLVRAPIYPDPLADEGAQRFTYALLPHGGDWIAGRVREEAEDLNQPLLAVEAEGLAAGSRSPLRVDGHPVALAVLKPAEDTDEVVLRVFEPAGGRGPLHVEAEAWRVEEEVDILERPLGPARVDIRPFELRSLRLRRDGR